MTDTNPPADRTAEVRARLNAASKGTTMDVHAGRSTLRATVTGGGRAQFVDAVGNLVGAFTGSDTGPLTVTLADDEDGRDATLALHARDDLAYLLARVEELERKLGLARQYQLAGTVAASADYCRIAQWRTTDPGERARAMGVPRPEPEMEGQLSLLDQLEAAA